MENKMEYTNLLQFGYFLIIFSKPELLGNTKADITADIPNI